MNKLPTMVLINEYFKTNPKEAELGGINLAVISNKKYEIIIYLRLVYVSGYHVLVD